MDRLPTGRQLDSTGTGRPLDRGGLPTNTEENIERGRSRSRGSDRRPSTSEVLKWDTSTRKGLREKAQLGELLKKAKEDKVRIPKSIRLKIRSDMKPQEKQRRTLSRSEIGKSPLKNEIVPDMIEEDKQDKWHEVWHEGQKAQEMGGPLQRFQQSRQYELASMNEDKRLGDLTAWIKKLRELRTSE